MVNAQGLEKHVVKFFVPGPYGTRDVGANVLGDC